jgi:hypothetical protein
MMALPNSTRGTNNFLVLLGESKKKAIAVPKPVFANSALIS